MQKYLLKQQFEGFSMSASEGLHKGYDRFQTLMSQLEIHDAGVSHDDANQKFLRSLPSSWSQVALIMRTKPGLDTLSFDDLYNNLRVFEHDVKGTTASSSNTHNVAFVSAKNTSSTNDVSTAYSVSSYSISKSQKEGSSSYSDEVIHSFFVNQSSAPQLDYDDLEQINDDDMEEMDLKWQASDVEDTPVNDRFADGMKSRRKVTEVPQPSNPTKHVADKAINEEMDDNLERAATTPTSLDAEQDRGGGSRCQEIMRDTVAQTRFLDLETTKTTQALEIDSLKRRVKKFKKRKKSRTYRLKRLYKGRIADIDANEDIYLVNVHNDEDMFGVNDLDGDEVIVKIVDVTEYVVPTGRVVVPTGRYVVPAGNIIVVSASRLSVIPTGRVLSPGSDNESDDASIHNEATNTQQQPNIQPQIINTVLNNNAKFPYLKNDEYESILDDHVIDFHYMDDAKDIWNAVKARFGGNAESKKMRKSMLKQKFLKFRIGEAEGLHKGYDMMQKILSQLNQLNAKP
nr:hypothetical protein [Tanacetum cinerariifolium]